MCQYLSMSMRTKERVLKYAYYCTAFRLCYNIRQMLTDAMKKEV